MENLTKNWLVRDKKRAQRWVRKRRADGWVCARSGSGTVLRMCADAKINPKRCPHGKRLQAVHYNLQWVPLYACGAYTVGELRQGKRDPEFRKVLEVRALLVPEGERMWTR